MKDNEMFLFQKVHTWCTSFQKGNLEEYEMYLQVIFRKLLDEKGLLLSQIETRNWVHCITYDFTFIKLLKEEEVSIPYLQELLSLSYGGGLKQMDFYKIKIKEDSRFGITIKCFRRKYLNYIPGTNQKNFA